MKRSILGILELDAVAGSRWRAATAKVGVSCEEEDGAEGMGRGGTEGWSRGREIAGAGGDADW